LKYALLNFEPISEEQLQIPVTNRAFQYNDGSFETMLFTNGKVRFLEDHLSRLQKAAQVLQLELPAALLEQETIAFWIKKLIVENKLSGNIRIKLKVWRRGNGLYTPDENTAECLITVEPQMESSHLIEKADFAETVRTNFSNYSFFKEPNSLQYVLASIEKKKRNLDEIILLSSDGNVSECLASNIFWIKNGTVFTSKTETGCVAGIMRLNLLRLFRAKNIPLQEGFYLPEALFEAEVVFTSNVAGIKIIRQIQETTFRPALPPFLQDLLFQLL